MLSLNAFLPLFIKAPFFCALSLASEIFFSISAIVKFFEYINSSMFFELKFLISFFVDFLICIFNFVIKSSIIVCFNIAILFLVLLTLLYLPITSRPCKESSYFIKFSKLVDAFLLIPVPFLNFFCNCLPFFVPLLSLFVRDFISLFAVRISSLCVRASFFLPNFRALFSLFFAISYTLRKDALLAS